MGRRAFTLIELLLVVAVIAVLAALAIPAISLIQRQARSTEAMNNMRGLFAGIAVYQGDYQDEVFPPSLSWMFRPGGTMVEDAPAQVLIDTIAGDVGTPRFSNRHSRWTDLEYLLQREHFPCSLVYEVSSASFPHVEWATPRMAQPWSQPLIDPAFPDPPYQGQVDPGAIPASVTWYDFKREQQLRGNLTPEIKAKTEYASGAPFPKGSFPIVRNFWHYTWTGTPKDLDFKRVLNLSWNGEVFKSSPYWEYDVNPECMEPPG